jgi:hypothetical protein
VRKGHLAEVEHPAQDVVPVVAAARATEWIRLVAVDD